MIHRMSCHWLVADIPQTNLADYLITTDVLSDHDDSVNVESSGWNLMEAFGYFRWDLP